MTKLVFILMLFFVFATLVVLVAGVIVMGRGGKLDRKWSNKLMVARVTLQAIAIVLLGVLFLLS